VPGTPEMSGIVPIADESLKPHGAISVVTHKYLHRAVPAGPGGGAAGSCVRYTAIGVPHDMSWVKRRVRPRGI